MDNTQAPEPTDPAEPTIEIVDRYNLFDRMRDDTDRYLQRSFDDFELSEIYRQINDVRMAYQGLRGSVTEMYQTLHED